MWNDMNGYFSAHLGESILEITSLDNDGAHPYQLSFIRDQRLLDSIVSTSELVDSSMLGSLYNAARDSALGLTAAREDLWRALDANDPF